MRHLRALLVAVFLVAVPALPHAARTPPRLVVLLSIDQFRGDYVERYGGQWTQGLGRLLSQGAYYSQAAYPYMNTVTCAGHATMSTGTFPATHGMPLNAWWDRDAGRLMLCTQDPSATTVTYGSIAPAASGGDSLWRLRVTTFSDELRLQARVPPRIVSISMKARAAMTLGGHRGDLVTWFDGPRGFVTSSAYAPGRVPFLEKFLAANPIEADGGKIWQRSMPAEKYLYDDAGLGEKPQAPWTPVFPHALPGAPGQVPAEFYGLWEDTPLADAYLARMATAAVEAFGMGRGERTDFLAVSFSSLDLTGHAFGPRSHEVQDVLAQADVTIGRLLADLDRLVGRDRYVVVLTGDHGVAPIPEQTAAEGIEAGRIAIQTLTQRIDAALEPFFGPGPHVDAIVYTDVYFKPGLFAKLQAQPDAMKAVVQAIEATPGVLRVIRSDHIADVHLGVDQLARTSLYSYAPGRSGDILIVPRPYFITSTAVTTHGTGYRYDARVPVILFGTGIRPGEHLAPVTPADIVPTLAWLVGITMPRTDGHVLEDALIEPAPPSPVRPGTAGSREPNELR